MLSERGGEENGGGGCWDEKKGGERRINIIRVWMGSQFCQFYTKKCYVPISAPLETCVFGNWSGPSHLPKLSNVTILVTFCIDYIYMHSIITRQNKCNFFPYGYQP